MDKKAPTKICILKRWPFLKISIYVIGSFVIFGLGFALGLHYAQNLYLVQEKSVTNKILYNEYNSSTAKTPDEFSFYYRLKKFNHEDIRRKDETIVSKKDNVTKHTYKTKENKDFDFHENYLPESKSGYTIQVYSFKSKELSERKVLELKKRGYPAYESKKIFRHNGILYRVRIGHFKKRDEATGILEKIIETENKEAYITRN